MAHTWCLKKKKYPKITINYHKHFIRSLRKCHPVRRTNELVSKLSIWQDIIAEDREFETYIKKEKQKNLPTFHCASNYLKKELFPILIPAFEKVCHIMLKKCVLYKQVRFFDFIDFLVEILYHTNPLHTSRKYQWKCVHLIYRNRKRQYFPYYWFLSEDEAATKIQALVRGFLVRTKYDMESMKEEHRKIREGIEKQKKCYSALKEDIERIYDTFTVKDSMENLVDPSL